MARIAVGGWQHETNTFATIKADFAAFERADEWPPLAFGDEMLVQTKGVHLPITGAVDVLSQGGHELVPILWCSATPCSYVTEHAFETISERFLTLLQEALPVDGVYLDLHGAMVCEHVEDGEGEFLRRVREVVGKDLPVVVSLDLHANITPAMVEYATLIDVFRTYPHIDMGETGARAAESLVRILDNGKIPVVGFRQANFIVPLNTGCSLIEPCQSIYRQLPSLIQGEVQSASFACGFHLSDIFHVGPSVLTYADTEEAAETAVEQLLEWVHSNESVFYEKVWLADEAVNHAIESSRVNHKPIVIADTQDNPGGGGSGDTTGLLQALLNQGATNALFGVLSDPAAVTLAQAAGIGESITLQLGGRSGLAGQQPFVCHCKVLNLTDGQLVATGPMYRGAKMTLGDCALLLIDGVEMAVSSNPVQTADQAILRHFGIDLNEKDIIVLKSSVHFRNDFTELAGEILLAAAPGAVFADLATLTYQHKRESIRIL